MNHFELQLLDWIQNNLTSPLLDAFFKSITRLGDKGIFWIAIALLLCVSKRTRKYGYIMFISFLLEAVCVNLLLKPLVARTRPFVMNPDIPLMIKPPSDYSFPSGHAGISFAGASALLFGKSKLWIPFMILAFFIALSRVYLYIHFPTDVLCGSIIGLLSGWAAAKLYLFLQKKTQK